MLNLVRVLVDVLKRLHYADQLLDAELEELEQLRDIIDTILGD